MLAPLREQFHIPPTADSATIRTPGSEALYFCGNSLGLQPRAVQTILNEELDKWRQFGVEVCVRSHSRSERDMALLLRLYRCMQRV